MVLWPQLEAENVAVFVGDQVWQVDRPSTAGRHEITLAAKKQHTLQDGSGWIYGTLYWVPHYMHVSSGGGVGCIVGVGGIGGGGGLCGGAVVFSFGPCMM